MMKYYFDLEINNNYTFQYQVLYWIVQSELIEVC